MGAALSCLKIIDGIEKAPGIGITTEGWPLRVIISGSWSPQRRFIVWARVARAAVSVMASTGERPGSRATGFPQARAVHLGDSSMGVSTPAFEELRNRSWNDQLLASMFGCHLQRTPCHVAWHSYRFCHARLSGSALISTLNGSWQPLPVDIGSDNHCSQRTHLP